MDKMPEWGHPVSTEIYEYYGATGYSNQSESKGVDEDKKQITVCLLGELAETPDKVQDIKTLLMDIRRHRDRRNPTRIKKRLMAIRFRKG